VLPQGLMAYFLLCFTSPALAVVLLVADRGAEGQRGREEVTPTVVFFAGYSENAIKGDTKACLCHRTCLQSSFPLSLSACPTSCGSLGRTEGHVLSVGVQCEKAT